MKSVICPICDKHMDNQGPKEWPAWPFCSERCRLVDLGRWLKQDYAVPATSPQFDEDDDPASANSHTNSEGDEAS